MHTQAETCHLSGRERAQQQQHWWNSFSPRVFICKSRFSYGMRRGPSHFRTVFLQPPKLHRTPTTTFFFFFSPIFVIHSPEKAKEESVCLHPAKCSYSAPRALPGARPSSNTRRSGSQMDRTRKTTQGVTELE